MISSDGEETKPPQDLHLIEAWHQAAAEPRSRLLNTHLLTYLEGGIWPIRGQFHLDQLAYTMPDTVLGARHSDQGT